MPKLAGNLCDLFHFVNDGARQILIDLVMAWHRLGYFGVMVGVPVVSATVADKDAAHFLQLLDQVPALHATRNSSVWRIYGI